MMQSNFHFTLGKVNRWDGYYEVPRIWLDRWCCEYCERPTVTYYKVEADSRYDETYYMCNCKKAGKKGNRDIIDINK
jgi:hypothetical protein